MQAAGIADLLSGLLDSGYLVGSRDQMGHAVLIEGTYHNIAADTVAGPQPQAAIGNNILLVFDGDVPVRCCHSGHLDRLRLGLSLGGTSQLLQTLSNVTLGHVKNLSY